jgi:hypothetical protein
VYIIWLYGYFKGYCEFSFTAWELTMIDGNLYAVGEDEGDTYDQEDLPDGLG